MALLKYFKKVDHSEDPTERDEAKKRGSYMKLSMKEKAEIGKYTSKHGVTKAKKSN